MTPPTINPHALGPAIHHFGGRGQPILVCHATGLCGRVYEALADELIHTHDVFAVDLRGHGNSPPADLDSDLDWPTLARDVVGATQTIDRGPIHVFGHSLGGALALYAAALNPGLFKAAYVYEPILSSPLHSINGPANPLAEAALRRQERFESRQEAMWTFSRKAPFSHVQSRCLASYVEHAFNDTPGGGIRLKCSPRVESRIFAASGSITTEDLRGLTIPVAIATGVQTTQRLSEAMRAVLVALPHAMHVRFDHLGHLGPLEDPPRVGRSIAEFTTNT